MTSNPEQAQFALGCSLDAYAAGLGAGRSDLIRAQDRNDFELMAAAQGQYRLWLLIENIAVRGCRPPPMSILQEEFEDWARSARLSVKRCSWDSQKYDLHTTTWAWRAWQARSSVTSSTEPT